MTDTLEQRARKLMEQHGWTELRSKATSRRQEQEVLKAVKLTAYERAWQELSTEVGKVNVRRGTGYPVMKQRPKFHIQRARAAREAAAIHAIAAPGLAQVLMMVHAAEERECINSNKTIKAWFGK